jgi:hypothetical protein
MSLPDTPGLRLLSSAFAFWRAAKLLHEDDPRSLAWAPCFVNLGLAIELGLKGFLREKGMSDAEQKALGHDLVKAFQESVVRGFSPTHALQSRLADEINPHYKDMSLRYQIGGGADLPLLQDAINVTSSLMQALYHQSTARYR